MHSTPRPNECKKQGVFIANQMVARRDGEDVADAPDKPAVYTRISFNGGGAWQPIRAPARFNSAKCDRCGGRRDDCYLHLHGASSWFFGAVQYPSVYSHASAPGLLVGTGNVAAAGLGLEDGDGCARARGAAAASAVGRARPGRSWEGSLLFARLLSLLLRVLSAAAPLHPHLPSPSHLNAQQTNIQTTTTQKTARARGSPSTAASRGPTSLKAPSSTSTPTGAASS